MSRYRKIDTRIHGDEKFRKLSRPKACGQSLWWYLLAPREATNLPGVIIAGEHTLANDLGWSLTSFRKVMSEIVNQNMAFCDWQAPIVFLPNAIKYHQPESLNVIKSWRLPWDEVPECELKDFIYQTLRAYIAKNMSDAFLKIYDSVIPYGFREGKAVAIPEAIGKAIGYTGAGAGAGAGAASPPLSFPNLKSPSALLEQNANGSENAPKDFQKFWAPVEGYLRSQVVPESFQEFYSGIRIVGVNHNAVQLAVPQALIDREGGEHEAAEFMIGKIRSSKTGLLRGRLLKLISIEKFIEQELS